MARHYQPSRPNLTMKPRITVITLGVDDLNRSLAFYRDSLGFATQGIFGTEFEHGAVAFFDLQPGLKLALWPRASIAHDTGIPLSGRSPTELTIGHNVRTREEVDTVMAQAQRAGAHIVKPAQDTFWGGYAGYFQDPDEHLWEVVWNPQFELVE
jgi:catechol 2,3-dioxygenase-like lactoylglutathione lyase family enzyme